MIIMKCLIANGCYIFGYHKFTSGYRNIIKRIILDGSQTIRKRNSCDSVTVMKSGIRDIPHFRRQDQISTVSITIVESVIFHC
ncbi:hypothetical protein SDC9_141397 [bioreactor metagenome]|uniref:Uncharacterized protein n=1 Tax=bioreactor metagenome TaxID=1076179 RepID=A0A645DY62_9ZZZZ